MKNYIRNNYDTIILIIVFILLNINTNYMIYRPGGTIDLDKRVTSKYNYKKDGSFEMIYVNLTKARVPFYLYSKINKNWELVHKDELFIDNKDSKEMIKRDKLMYDQSIEDAKLVALNHAKKTFKLKDEYTTVMYTSDFTNEDILVGDHLLKYDNNKFKDFSLFKEYINTKKDNDQIELNLLRDNKKLNIKTKVKEEDNEKYIGVMLSDTYKVDTDLIDVNKTKKEAGPSGGLMLALSMYNNLTKEDITKGYKIAGTGTIDKNGNVGAIGGIEFKLNSAIKAKADYIIVPKENKKELENNGNLSKINVLYVSTFKETLKKLKEI